MILTTCKCDVYGTVKTPLLPDNKIEWMSVRVELPARNVNLDEAVRMIDAVESAPMPPAVSRYVRAIMGATAEPFKARLDICSRCLPDLWRLMEARYHFEIEGPHELAEALPEPLRAVEDALESDEKVLEFP